MSILDRLFSRPRLRDVHEATLLKVRGKLASPHTVQSPVTPVRAVLLHYQLLERHVFPRTLLNSRGGRTDDDITEDTVVYTSPLFSEEIILVEADDGVISVPTASLAVHFASGSRHAEPLLGTLRPDLATEVARVTAAGTGEICYREQFLLEDDPVELEAWIRPEASHAGPYRGSAAPYVVCRPHAKLLELSASDPISAVT